MDRLQGNECGEKFLISSPSSPSGMSPGADSLNPCIVIKVEMERQIIEKPNHRPPAYEPSEDMMTVDEDSVMPCPAGFDVEMAPSPDVEMAGPGMDNPNAVRTDNLPGEVKEIEVHSEVDSIAGKSDGSNPGHDGASMSKSSKFTSMTGHGEADMGNPKGSPLKLSNCVKNGKKNNEAKDENKNGRKAAAIVKPSLTDRRPSAPVLSKDAPILSRTSTRRTSKVSASDVDVQKRADVAGPSKAILVGARQSNLRNSRASVDLGSSVRSSGFSVSSAHDSHSLRSTKNGSVARIDATDIKKDAGTVVNKSKSKMTDSKNLMTLNLGMASTLQRHISGGLTAENKTPSESNLATATATLNPMSALFLTRRTSTPLPPVGLSGDGSIESPDPKGAPLLDSRHSSTSDVSSLSISRNSSVSQAYSAADTSKFTLIFKLITFLSCF